MICLTSARGSLLNVSIAISKPIVIACRAYCLFVISLYFCFRSCLLDIFVWMYFFSFDATILMNKDVYINSENREQLTRELQFHQQDIHRPTLRLLNFHT